VAASDFFFGPVHTEREPGELLVGIEVPEQPEGTGAGFAEQARTHGDFATAGAAAVVAPGRHAGLALLGAGPAPTRVEGAERALVDGASPREAAALAAEEVDDEHRRALCIELARRAIEEALA
jgi:carbon-monoxide dehydrogenase medium subunit